MLRALLRLQLQGAAAASAASSPSGLYELTKRAAGSAWVQTNAGVSASSSPSSLEADAAAIGARAWWLPAGQRRHKSSSTSAASALQLLKQQQPELALQAAQVQALMTELDSLEGTLKRMSDPDGTRRIPLSLDKLPEPLPQHTVEPGLHTINAYVRGQVGSIATKWLRRVSRTPVRVQAVWGKRSLQLSIETRHAVQMVNMWGRHGCEARVLALRIVKPRPYPRPGDKLKSEEEEEEGGPTVPDSEVLGVIRVKPKQVHMMPTSNQIENIDMVFCPQDRLVKANVPVRLVNDDVAPGVKGGGWVHLVRRTVTIRVLGSEVPPFLEVDCKALKLNEFIRARDVPLPPSAQLVRSRLQPTLAIVARCTTLTGTG